jgi:PAS domain S-box-containing protein
MGNFYDNGGRLSAGERWYRLLAENVNDLIWTMSMDLRFTYMSPSVSRVLGFTAEEYVGRSLEEVMTPDSFKAIDAIIKEELERQGDHVRADQDRSRVVESELFTKNGATIATETRASFLRDESDRPVGFLGVTRDITERRKTEERAGHMAMIAEQAVEGMAVSDLEGIIQFANTAWASMHGYESADGLVGRHLSVFHTKEQMKNEVVPFNESVKRKGCRTGEVGHVRRDGSVFQSEMAVCLFRDRDGRPIGLNAVMTDITERKRAEEEMRRRLEFEKTVSAISSRFIASDIDSAVEAALEDMGRLSGASRAYLFLFDKHETVMNNTHEWCAQEVVPEIDNLQNLPADTFPWWMKKLRRGEVIHVEDVSRLPPEAQAEKEILEDQDIKSLLVFPLGVGGRLGGFVGFDDVVAARGWSEEDLGLLQICSDVIGNAVYRQRAEAALRAARDGLERRVRERTSRLEEVVGALQKSEASLAEAQRIAGLGNWEWNVLTDEMTWSDEVCRLFDTAPEQLGTRYTDFLKSVHPEDRQVVENAARMALREKRPYELDHRIVLADGTQRVVHQRGEVICDCTGRPARLFGIIQDITERKRLEEDLARLAAATESSADGIVITDPNGIIQYVNPAFERISGFSREECVGQDIRLCDGSERDRGFRGEVFEVLNREGVWRGCLARTKKDGSSYREERTITAVRDGSGEVVNYAHIIRDVTEKLRLESIAQAVNTMSNTAYIFSGIRHEIGNPINAVGVVLKTLKSNIDNYDKPAICDYLDRALHEISTVEVLLNNLKSFNMYENPDISVVNLPDFMDKFLTLVRPDSEEKGVAIAASVAPDAESCRADPRALQQVLMNVLTNAWDACGGRENSRISVEVARHREMIQIEVSDNGCGMSAKQQENLFRPFYTGKPHGTGLGLAIARKMLAMMNSSIEVTSNEGVGTTASIQLPEARSETR